MNKLHNLILEDLNRVGLKTDFRLEIRGYSKRYEGRYDPNTETVVIYANNERNELIDYEHILDIAIHEATHHFQWKHDPNFIRVKGVMHNQEFYELYEMYHNRLKVKKNRGVLKIAKTYSKEDTNYRTYIGSAY